MKRGFMFSIEALLSIALVASAIALTAYSFGYSAPSSSPIEIGSQADAAYFIYSGGSSAVPDMNNMACTKVAYYDKASKSVSEKSVCRGYR